MFENMTYENILSDMLSRVTSDVDKREGSVIYDALAPCAYQLSQTYFNLNSFLDLVFGDTAVGEYLDRVVADYGLTRKPATNAVRRVETTDAVSIGTRWGLNETTYEIIEKLSSTTYNAKCEQTGEIGNLYSGTLENIDNVGSVTATITSIISSGEDEETDENLRARFYAKVQAPATSGNANSYKQWALEVAGVGNARVFPLWNGNGTVKVLVIDENMSIDSTLESKVYDYIESMRPIGANVTVNSPSGKSINVAANVILNGSKTLSEIIAAFTTALTSYLKDIIFKEYTISYAKIGSLLLATPGVQDYSSLKVNLGTANLTLLDTEIPVNGTVAITEVV